MKRIEKGVFIQMEYAGEQRILEVSGLSIHMDDSGTQTLVYMDAVFEKLHIAVSATWLLGGLKKGHYKAKCHAYSTGTKVNYKGHDYKVLSKQVSEEFELTYCLKRQDNNQFIVITEQELKGFATSINL